MHWHACYLKPSWQPADWDDREYIDDPNDVKPEVLHFAAILGFQQCINVYV